MIASEECNNKLSIHSGTYADFLVKYLEWIGTKLIYMIVGGANEPLTQSICHEYEQGKIDYVFPMSELGLGFCLYGYSKESGKLGVGLVTSGPGVTSGVTDGMEVARKNNVPFLLLSGQSKTTRIGNGGFQYSDTISMLDAVTVYNTSIDYVDQMIWKLDKAVREAYIQRGPVHLSIPIDILQERIITPLVLRDSPIPEKDNYLFNADSRRFRRIFKLLEGKKQILLILGQNCDKRTMQSIIKFSELKGVPFVTSPQGKTWVNSSHSNYYGVYGFSGDPSATAIVENSNIDCKIIVGHELADFSTEGGKLMISNCCTIYIDENEKYFDRIPYADLRVSGPIDEIFENITKEISESYYEIDTIPNNELLFKSNVSSVDKIAYDKNHNRNGSIKPQYLFEELSKRSPTGTLFYGNTGKSWWGMSYVEMSREGTFNVEQDHGSMNWWRCVIGVSEALKEKNPNNTERIVCFLGDGSAGMGSNDMLIAVERELPIIFVILDDGKHGLVEDGQILANLKAFGCERRHKINWSESAKSMHMPYVTLDNKFELDRLDIDSLFERNRPSIIVAKVDFTERANMGTRLRIMHKEFAEIQNV